MSRINNGMRRLTTEEWVQKAHTIHGNKYTYLNAEYVNSSTQITITCKAHGDFKQRPTDHVAGRGCPSCSGVKRWTTKQFITRAKAIHGDAYSYAKSQYTGVYNNTTITCKLHGDFQQSPGNHVNKKAGCPVCAKLTRDRKQTKTTEQFIAQSIKKHKNTYDYTQTKYVHSHQKVKIGCVSHGVFEQAPGDHLYGTGCPVCAVNKRNCTSVGEQQVAAFVEALGAQIIRNDRTVLSPQELDIYIPAHNLAIEYCGLYWHSEQLGKNKHYHKGKHDKCKQQGIQLLTIFEDEWANKRSQVERKLKSLLHVDVAATYARNCSVRVVDGNAKRTFFDDHHIQGNGPGSINLGLYHHDNLVACMSFIVQKDKHYLNRYASSTRVVGGFSKLLKHFQRTTQWTQIVSFADQRWSNGNLYTSTGWVLDKTIPPDYSYTPQGSNHRAHKFNYRRKYLPTLLTSFVPELSEWENCKANNVLRIWDCGKLRFVLNR